MSSKKPTSFLTQILIYGSGLALNYGIGFVLLPIYSRLMPTEQYGMLEILNRTMEIVSLLLLTQYGITYIRFFRDKNDEQYQRTVTSTSMYVVGGVSVFIAAILALARAPLAEVLFDSSQYSHYIVLIAARYVLDMSFVVPFLYFQATEQPGKYIVISSTKFALTLILNIVLITMMEDKVAAVLWAQILSALVYMATFGVWVFLRSTKTLDFALSKQILKFTWSFSFLGAYTFVIASGDRFVLNEYCGKSEVGIYSAGYRIAQVLSVLVFSPIIRAWSPRMVDQLRSPDGPQQLAKLTSYSMVLYAGLGLALSIYSRELISVFVGDKYYACYTMVPIIVLGYLFQGFSMYVDGGIFYSKKTHLKIWHWITAVVCIGLYFTLIPRYCGIGAAWASMLTYVVLALVNWYIAMRVFPMKYELGKLGLVTALGVALYVVSRYLEIYEAAEWEVWRQAGTLFYPISYPAIMLIIKLPLLWAFAVGVYVIKIVEPKDKEKLLAILQKMKEKVTPGSRDAVAADPNQVV